MLFIIAWRNVWRSKVRSLVVMLAIALGLGLGVFLMSFSWGMNKQRSQNLLETQISHVQIHQAEFKDETSTALTIPKGSELVRNIQNKNKVKSATGRVVLSGMISSSAGGFGVMVQGVNPKEEAIQTKLDKKLVEGAYFEGIKRNPILISKRLAEKLKLKIRKKVVLTFQDVDGEITAGAFRVVGLYESLNSKLDETNVYINISDARKLIGDNTAVHELAVLLEDQKEAKAFKQQLAVEHPGLLIEDWGDLAPDLKLVDESFATMMQVFLGIIMLGMAFGIINTMLMAVLERKRELGMLMAVGMNKTKVFFMIMLETIFMAVVGGISGILIAILLVNIFGIFGIPMSAFQEGLSTFGMADRVYTSLEPRFYVMVANMVIITAILAAIYPALRALKLKPVEAIRSI